MLRRLPALPLLLLAALLLPACPSGSPTPGDEAAPSADETRENDEAVGGEAAEADEAPAAQLEADEARDERIADPGAIGGQEYPCGSMLNRSLVARSIENREPVGTRSPFEADGEPVHVFMELNNPNTEATMTVRWFHDGSQHRFGQTITAGVSPSWRTWVRHRILPEQTGRWRVQIFAPGECLAGELSFDAI